MKRLLTLAFLLLLCGHLHAQLYVGMTGDFGNKMSIGTDGSVQGRVSGSLGMSVFLDMQLAKNLYLKTGLSSGFINSKVVVPTLENFSVVPVTGFYHISANLDVGHRFPLANEKFIDAYLGGGFSFIGGEDAGGRLGPSSTSDYVFTSLVSTTNNNPNGFVELLVQGKINRIMLIGLRYQHHFKEAVSGVYTLVDNSQQNPSTAGTLSLTPGALSLLVSFRIANLRR